MKKGIISISLVILSFLSTGKLMTAQEYTVPEIKLSSEKVRYEGKIYYSHIVKEKQTLYSISKAYGVTVEEIYAVNPGLEQNGLKKDSYILIPVATSEKQSETKGGKQTEKQEGKRPEGIFKKKETTREDPVQTRPETAVEASAETPAESPVKPLEYDGETVNHRVKWYDDIESIAAQYGVSVGSIMAMNNLKDKTLKPRQILVIPLGGDPARGIEIPAAGAQEPAVEKVNEEVAADETAVEESPAEAPAGNPAVFERKDDITIMLMVPLKAASGGNNNYFDFYSGILLGAKEKADEGIHININAIDVASGIPDLDAGEFEAADVIIGPVSTEHIEKLMPMIPLDKYVVSPMDPKVESLTAKYPNLIHAPTPASNQFADILRWIDEDSREGDRTIVIYEKGSKEVDASSEINRMIDQSNLSVEKLSYGILEGRNQMGHLKNMMNQEAVNRVVIASEKETFVNDVVRNINLMIHDGYNVAIYSPSKIKSFESIEVDNLHNANLHVSMTYFVDYDSSEVQSFLMKYRGLFNTEPTAFSFQGYDMIRLFGSLVSEYGDRWYEKIQGEHAPQLQENYNFIRNNDGGFINKAVKRAVYNADYSVSYYEKDE